MTSFWTELLGCELGYVDAGGIRTRRVRAGRGEPVILIHGIGATLETWVRNVVPLSERFDVHAFDLLGHGLTGTVDGPLTLDAFVDHLIGYLDAEGIERAHLVGLSLGGWLATWVGLRRPERVGKIVTAVSAHLRVPVDEADRRHAEAGTEQLRQLTRAFVTDPSPQTLRARLGWVFLDPERQLTDELVECRWALYRRATNGQQIAAIVGNPGAGTLLTPERLGELTVPTLLVWTDHNPSTTANEARLAADAVPNGGFVVMDDCSHWPQWEDAARFNEIVAGFLALR